MALCHDVTDDLPDEHVTYFKDGRWMTYAEMIASMDDMVGRLIAALERTGLRENTLVIFTTDNGTAGSSYPTIDEDGKMVRPKVVSVRDGKVVPGGKGKLDDTGTRVPLIANWPGHIEPGQTVEAMLDLTDYLPTLAEVAGLPNDNIPRDGVARDGISFAPQLLGDPNRRQQRSWVYLELSGKRCLRSPDWKLYADGRFFDLQNDPLEERSLSKSQLTGEAAHNHAELDKVLNELKGPLPNP